MNVTREKASRIYNRYVKLGLALFTSFLLLISLATVVFSQSIALVEMSIDMSMFDIVKQLFTGNFELDVAIVVLTAVMMLIAFSGLVTIIVAGVRGILSISNKEKEQKYNGIIIANIVLSGVFTVLGILVFALIKGQVNNEYTGYNANQYDELITCSTTTFIPFIFSALTGIGMIITGAVINSIKSGIDPVTGLPVVQPSVAQPNVAQPAMQAQPIMQAQPTMKATLTGIDLVKSELMNAKGMLDSGLINEAEYNEIKAKLIASNKY